jgi:hypothetical protein
LGYEISYIEGEHIGCSSKITVADRIFYAKLYSAAPPKFFSGDQQGVIQKEISKAEFELWINILADDEKQAQEIQQKMATGKKY